jgi:hypothetical protein
MSFTISCSSICIFCKEVNNVSARDQGGKIPLKGNNIKVASLGVCSSVIERWEKMLPLPSSSQLIKKIYEAKERFRPFWNFIYSIWYAS